MLTRLLWTLPSKSCLEEEVRLFMGRLPPSSISNTTTFKCNSRMLRSATTASQAFPSPTVKTRLIEVFLARRSKEPKLKLWAFANENGYPTIKKRVWQTNAKSSTSLGLGRWPHSTWLPQKSRRLSVAFSSEETWRQYNKQSLTGRLLLTICCSFQLSPLKEVQWNSFMVKTVS